MTTQANIPAKWYVPFANGDGSRVELPVTTADPTRASQTLGFPPLTMQPPESGGVPPQGEDFNGGMNQIARVAWWVLNGGGWPYDASFATQANIQGYPNGATLQSADFRGDWINTADNNQNNPDTTGTGWVPGFQYGVTALSGLTGGTVTPTPAQAAKNSITLAGTLGSALTIVLPTWLKNWTITNNTTGAFVTIVKTVAGSGVTIPQNGAPTRVTGDGTNIVQIGENIASGTQPTQPLQVQQKGIQVFTASGSFTVPAGVTKLFVSGAGGGGGGGGNPGTSSSANFTSGAGGGGAGQPILRNAYTVAPGQVITITIGAAGAAGIGASGGSGGNTVIGSLVTLTGGSGGGISSVSSANAPGGAPGGGSPSGGYGGDGAAGGNGATGAAVGGGGASGPFGGGGFGGRGSTSTLVVGAAAFGFGAGGGGCGGSYTAGIVSAQNGGGGAPGIVIVEW